MHTCILITPKGGEALPCRDLMPIRLECIFTNRVGNAAQDVWVQGLLLALSQGGLAGLRAGTSPQLQGPLANCIELIIDWRGPDPSSIENFIPLSVLQNPLSVKSEQYRCWDAYGEFRVHASC